MKKVIITIGPSIMRSTTLETIDNENYIYRINGAHADARQADDYITAIREHLPEADIMLDLPGNKVRTENLKAPIPLKPGETFCLAIEQVNYRDFRRHLKEGDEVLASDSTLKFTVKNINDREITFISASEGRLENGRGLHVRGIHDNIPFLFPRDMELIQICNQRQIDYVGLSFVRTADDVLAAQKLISKDIKIVSKIETAAAVRNLDDIIKIVEYLLVDRGDLSTEVGLEKIPAYQGYIIRKACLHNKKVFLSTQFLKNMEEKPVPTIAEVIDLYNTFSLGIYGIQLSEETSIGKYPVECLELIKRILREMDAEMG